VKFQENKIVIHSGGQTGVDRAALDFAICNGMSCTGWCAHDRKAEDGIINIRYPLRPVFSFDPDLRTELNVSDCDGTLIILLNEMDRGTRITNDWAKIYRKPTFIYTSDDHKKVTDQKFKRWLTANKINHLNVAGPRESNSPGIYNFALEVLTGLFLEKTVSFDFK